MEGLLRDAADGAPIVAHRQPDIEKQRLDNPIVVPGVLSFLTYGDGTRR